MIMAFMIPNGMCKLKPLYKNKNRLTIAVLSKLKTRTSSVISPGERNKAACSLGDLDAARVPDPCIDFLIPSLSLQGVGCSASCRVTQHL